MNMRIYINILFVLLIAGIVFPCSCLEPSPPWKAYEEADVILAGTVTSKVLDASGYYFEVSLQTIDVWKGDVLGEIIVLTEANSAACGYEFQINNDYLKLDLNEENLSFVYELSKVLKINEKSFLRSLKSFLDK